MFRWDIGGKFFTERVVRHLNRVSWAGVTVPESVWKGWGIWEHSSVVNVPGLS